jgi:hypothetical protein
MLYSQVNEMHAQDPATLGLPNNLPLAYTTRDEAIRLRLTASQPAVLALPAPSSAAPAAAVGAGGTADARDDAQDVMSALEAQDVFDGDLQDVDIDGADGMLTAW